MNEETPLLTMIQEILQRDPRAALILAEILGPPPGLVGGPPKPWET